MAYIKLEEAIEVCNKYKTFHKKENSLLGMAIANDIYLDIDNLPTADIVEVKHGEWILTKTEFGWNCCEYPKEYTCSECGRTEPQEEPYCHCGAKMDGERKHT